MATGAAKKNAASHKPGPGQDASSQISRSQPSKKKSYASEGANDNDLFLLPAGDYQVMAVLTVVAAVVRLFRIYQPTSVVFDEVQ